MNRDQKIKLFNLLKEAWKTDKSAAELVPYVNEEARKMGIFEEDQEFNIRTLKEAYASMGTEYTQFRNRKRSFSVDFSDLVVGNEPVEPDPDEYKTEQSETWFNSRV